MRCTIPRFPLVAGTYAFRAAILDPQIPHPITRIGWENTPVYFTVKSTSSEADNRHAVNGDLLVMDVSWEK